MGVQINKCDKNWNEIGNDATNNHCKYCQVCVPDISSKSKEEVETQFYQETCARVHDRHLEDNHESYFFVNKMESKIRKLGWLKTASVFVFLYLFVTGCYHRRTAGVAPYSGVGNIEHNVDDTKQTRTNE
jgi:hypothetical protein